MRSPPVKAGDRRVLCPAGMGFLLLPACSQSLSRNSASEGGAWGKAVVGSNKPLPWAAIHEAHFGRCHGASVQVDFL